MQSYIDDDALESNQMLVLIFVASKLHPSFVGVLFYETFVCLYLNSLYLRFLPMLISFPSFELYIVRVLIHTCKTNASYVVISYFPQNFTRKDPFKSA